ncbi:MAG: LuxR family transcriptional regulator [Phenylobacterium sp.]|nr:LuxR family transcriptional regulator [Phenylobacterium sp.]
MGQSLPAGVDRAPTPTAFFPANGVTDASVLSPRERQILTQIGQGRSNKEIARALGSSPETVKSHIKHIFLKLDVSRRAQAVLLGQHLGLLRTG